MSWRCRSMTALHAQSPPARAETGTGKRAIETCFLVCFFFNCVLDNSLFVWSKSSHTLTEAWFGERNFFIFPNIINKAPLKLCQRKKREEKREDKRVSRRYLLQAKRTCISLGIFLVCLCVAISIILRSFRWVPLPGTQQEQHKPWETLFPRKRSNL